MDTVFFRKGLGMAETTMNPRLNEINGQGIAPTRTSNPQDSLAMLLDRDWVKRSFMVSDAQLDDSTNIKNRYFSSADFKFVDTKLGRSFAINARPYDVTMSTAMGIPSANLTAKKK